MAEYESSHRQYLNKWAWLFSDRSLFSETRERLDLANWMELANFSLRNRTITFKKKNLSSSPEPVIKDNHCKQLHIYYIYVHIYTYIHMYKCLCTYSYAHFSHHGILYTIAYILNYSLNNNMPWRAFHIVI